LKTYSRRDFLKITGITLAASQMSIFPNFQRFFLQNTYQARALAAAPIYNAPNTSSEMVATLWPDSISHIRDANENWYRVSNGYVEREQLQPMFSQERTADSQIPAFPFWVEVVGPVAPIREHCAANAPLVTRIGHGGVAQVIDYLPGEPNGWYGICDDSGQLMGWTQAVHWLPIVETRLPENKNTIRIDLKTQTLSVENNGVVALQAPCCINSDTQAGIYALERQKPGGSYSADEQLFHGAPWQLNFGSGVQLTGAYWHNQFGKPLNASGVQVSPLLAQWLYSSTNPGDQLIVI
jgi:hypothetical protein